MKFTHHYLFDLRDNYLYKELTGIRKRPELWLGKKSLSAMYHYIRGCYLTYLNVNPDEGDWLVEFYQYVCDICVNGNGPYGPEKAILECGYDDESGFDYFFSLMDDYIKEHAIVSDLDIPEEVLHLKDEIRMVYIDWFEVSWIMRGYVEKNKNRLFRLLEGESNVKYKLSSTLEKSHDGIVFCISDGWTEPEEEMEKFAEDCKGKIYGISYKAVKLDKKDDSQ